MLDTVTQTRPETPSKVTQKIAIVIYSNVTSEALSRTYRAFGFAAELLAAGDDVAIVFDGGGSATLAAVLDPKHDLHRAWNKVAPSLRGVCSYCAKAYGVQYQLIAAGIPMLADDHGHASLRSLLGEGRQIITFEPEFPMTTLAMPALPALSAQTKGLGFGLAAVGMWAAYLAFARAGVNAGLTPVDFVFLRFVTAGAIMLPWLLHKGIANLGGVGWRRGAALALFAGPLFIALGVGGYSFAPLAHGAVVQPSALTLGAMAASWLIFGERPPRERALGVAIIVGGLVLIATGKGGAELPGAWRGDLLFITAGLFWVGFTVLLRHWKIGGIPATAAVAVISALFVLPAFVATQSFDRLAALPLAALLTQIVVQGLLSGVLAVIAYGKAVEHLGASKAALFPALVPAAALIVGVPVADELPAPAEWLGALMATLGLAVAVGVIRLGRKA